MSREARIQIKRTDGGPSATGAKEVSPTRERWVHGKLECGALEGRHLVTDIRTKCCSHCLQHQRPQENHSKRNARAYVVVRRGYWPKEWHVRTFYWRDGGPHPYSRSGSACVDHIQSRAALQIEFFKVDE